MSMQIMCIEYDMITYSDCEQKTLYKRWPDGTWEIEQLSDLDGRYYYHPLENARLERKLEEDYQLKTQGGEA